MKFSIANIGLIFLVLVNACVVQAAPYGGAALVFEDKQDLADMTVVLSAPKRISNSLEIEKQETVSGDVAVRLYELKSSAQLNRVFDHYIDGLSAQGNILFQCEKRACGSSNYWANTIFDEHKLYGRDSDQYYMASLKQDREGEYWTLVYIVKNGLRKKYVYEITISKKASNVDQELHAGIWVNGSAFGEGNITNKEVSLINNYLKAAGARELYLVVYADSQIKPAGSYWEQLNKKATAQADLLKSKLDDSQVPIMIKVLGPLHSDESFKKLPVWFRLYAY